MRNEFLHCFHVSIHIACAATDCCDSRLGHSGFIILNLTFVGYAGLNWTLRWKGISLKSHIRGRHLQRLTKTLSHAVTVLCSRNYSASMPYKRNLIWVVIGAFGHYHATWRHVIFSSIYRRVCIRCIISFNKLLWDRLCFCINAGWCLLKFGMS